MDTSSAARQHRLQHRLAQEAATLGAAMTVAATADDPVAVETAPLADKTPSAKLLRAPSARSKEDNAARKRAERLARSAGDAAAGSADESLSRGDQDAKAPPPPLAICNNWAAAALSAEILGMNPTLAELSVCARAQVAVRYEVNGRGRYRLLSHSMVLLNAQPAADSLPRECFNLQLATQTGSQSSHT